MPPRRKVYEEESEEDAASEAQSEPVEDDELDMEVDDEVDDEEGEDVDVEGDGEHDDEGVVDDKDVVEEDIEDELIDDSDIGDSTPAETRTVQPRLKIRLRLPQASALSTPPRARRQLAPRGSDIESEDEDEEDEDGEGEEGDSTRSTSVVTAAGSRALTARQAVLANVVDSSHVSLVEPPNPRKKKPLTEIEIALKREETARKRRNLTEKKLEDEKAETINRLLKKQSRARGKRNALSTAEDRPVLSENPPAEGEEEEVTELNPAPPPTMYRWVSSARSPAKHGKQTDAATERVMTLSFSVPSMAFPAKEGGEKAMDVDSAPVPPPPRLPPATPPKCDVKGCMALRKYRLVQDFEKGACGMGHLKLLEA